MREHLSCAPIERGFTRRERVSEVYEIDLAVTVGRRADGRIVIAQRNVTHGVGEGTIPLTDEQARIVIGELTRALADPASQEGAA